MAKSRKRLDYASDMCVGVRRQLTTYKGIATALRVARHGQLRSVAPAEAVYDLFLVMSVIAYLTRQQPPRLTTDEWLMRRPLLLLVVTLYNGLSDYTVIIRGLNSQQTITIPRFATPDELAMLTEHVCVCGCDVSCDDYAVSSLMLMFAAALAAADDRIPSAKYPANMPSTTGRPLLFMTASPRSVSSETE